MAKDVPKVSAMSKTTAAREQEKEESLGGQTRHRVKEGLRSEERRSFRVGTPLRVCDCEKIRLADDSKYAKDARVSRNVRLVHPAQVSLAGMQRRPLTFI